MILVLDFIAVLDFVRASVRLCSLERSTMHCFQRVGTLTGKSPQRGDRAVT